MAQDTFFLSWKLWLRLTFCLGSAICLVFLAGLVKLFFNNRMVRKHAVLDEEKRARQQEMRSSGIALPRKANIPFGVRAIQSGIEVDGIWISRPNTPADSEGASTKPSSLRGPDAEPKAKAKATTLPVEGPRQPSKQGTQTQHAARLSPRIQPVSNLSVETASPMAVRSASAKPITYKPRQASGLVRPHVDYSDSDSDVISRTEGQRAQPPKMGTYVPKNSASQGPHVGTMYSATRDRRYSSSSDERHGQAPARPVVQNVQAAHTPTRQRSPFDDPDPVSPTMDFLEDGGYFPPPSQSTRSRFDASAAEQSTSSERHMNARHHKNSSESTESRPGRRSSQTGSVHANTHTRRVNAGFEVLPAGTFTRTSSEMDLEAQAPRGAQRLQGKGRG